MGFLTPLRSAVLAFLLAASGALAAGPTEYQVKAVFLFNFTQFVDWPATAFANASSPLVIGVLGDDPFGATLEAAIEGETVNGRRLVVRRHASVDEVADCHVLFVNLPAGPALASALRQLRTRSVLTVSDSRNFARTGGVIEFVMVDDKIQLAINLDAARLAHLTISSKLLRPARIVKRAE